MNELQIFNNDDFGEIRTKIVDGNPLFVATDVAKALGYGNPNDAVQRHCKGIVKCDTPTSSGIQQMSYINEGNVYRLIMRSKLPSAERFEAWVMDEVLPTIRKTGTYNMPTTYKEALQQLLIQVEENERLEKQNEEMQPKADYFDALVDKKLNTCIRDTAKELGIKESMFVNWLLNMKYVYRQSGKLRPYADYCEKGKGYFVLKDRHNNNNGWVGQQMYITPKGKETFRLLINQSRE